MSLKFSGSPLSRGSYKKSENCNYTPRNWKTTQVHGIESTILPFKIYINITFSRNFRFSRSSDLSVKGGENRAKGRRENRKYITYIYGKAEQSEKKQVTRKWAGERRRSWVSTRASGSGRRDHVTRSRDLSGYRDHSSTSDSLVGLARMRARTPGWPSEGETLWLYHF